MPKRKPRNNKPLNVTLDPETWQRIERLLYTTEANGNKSMLVRLAIQALDEQKRRKPKGEK